MRYLASIVLLLLTCNVVFAQHTITGKVIDARTKATLPGVNVHVPNTYIGTTTNREGMFTLRVPHSTDSLTISFMGYTTQTMAISDSIMVIRLDPVTLSLTGIVVSASREAEDRSDAPLAIGTVSRQTLKETKASSLDQVLNKVSGVYMVNLGNEQHTMAIRQPIGYRSTYLYLEDGIPIRPIGDFNHNALIEINDAVLKRIEVIKGPSSSLYGSDAIGGAINFITRSPSTDLAGMAQAEMSDQGYKRADFRLSNTINKTGYFIGGYYANRHGGYIDHDDFHKLALTGRVDYRLNEGSNITTEATLVNYNTDQNGGLDRSDFYNENYTSLYKFTWRKVNALRIRSTWDKKWDENNHSNVTFYFRNNSVQQNPFYKITDGDNPLNANGEINDNYFHSFGMVAQHTKRFSFWDARWIMGIAADYSPAGYRAHYIRINRNGAGYYVSFAETDSLLTDYNARLLNTAAYTQWQFSPAPKLKVTAGLRYDRLDYLFDNHLPPSAYTGAPDAQNRFFQLTPKLGLTYSFTPGRGIYANYSVGFAPPDISDLYTGVKVPHLKPARYSNEEVGGWLNFAGNRGSLSVSLYYMEGKNEIVPVRLAGGVRTEENAERTRHYGLEYTLRFVPVKSVLFRFSGTNVDHQFVDYVENGQDYSRNDMPGAPHFIANMQVTYKPEFLKGFRISLEEQHLSKYYMDAANTQTYDGYDVFNIRLGYEFGPVDVWGHIINVGDTNYATSAEKNAYRVAYYPGMLRTFYFGVTYNFGGE